MTFSWSTTRRMLITLSDSRITLSQKVAAAMYGPVAVGSCGITLIFYDPATGGDKWQN